MGGTQLSLNISSATNGPPYLLDTHIWIWYLIASERLPRSLGAAIDGAAGGVWLSPISIWEAGMLHARGRVALEGGPRRWIEEARRAFPIQEAVVNGEVAIRSHEFDLGHRDPADHLLAATTLVYGLTLLTLDARLSATGWLPTRSS